MKWELSLSPQIISFRKGNFKAYRPKKYPKIYGKINKENGYA